MQRAVTGIQPFLVDDPAWAMDFAPNSTLVGVGDTMTRKRYADTLEVISRDGADAFYSGMIADSTISTIRERKGIMTQKDLDDYNVRIRNISQIDYRGFRITSGSSPSSGTVALSAMKVVEAFDAFGDAGNINLSTHRLDEAIRFAYGEVGRPVSNMYSTLTSYSIYREPSLVTLPSSISSASTSPAFSVTKQCEVCGQKYRITIPSMSQPTIRTD